MSDFNTLCLLLYINVFEYKLLLAKFLLQIIASDFYVQVIREPCPRTDRWISTSCPEEKWDNCKMVGADYFVRNLMSTVNFSNMLKKIPSDAITIEIGPHYLLQSILKRSLGSDASYIGLMKRNNENNAAFFLESMGK